MKFLLFLLTRKSPLQQAVDSFLRFNEGQKIKRKHRKELRDMEREKPVYKIPDYE
jgi:hypothetical protein